MLESDRNDLKSLTIHAMLKPPANARVNTCWLNLFSVELFLPVDAFNTAIAVAGSMPKRLPASTASAAARKPAADT